MNDMSIRYLSRIYDRQQGQSVGIVKFLSALATFRLWRIRVAERRALASLSARLLKDIGLTEEARLTEINKPFWKA